MKKAAGVRFDDDDKLTDIEQSFRKESTTRKDTWRWLYLNKRRGIRLDPDSCGSGSMRDAIADVLETNKHLAQELRINADKFMLPETRFDWIKEDERQLSWLFGRADALTEGVLQKSFPHLFGRDEIIAMIDLWDLPLEKKHRELDKLRALWEKQTIKDIPFEWFTDKKEGRDRCICARDWLMNSHLKRIAERHPIRNHSDLIMLFEEADASQFERKQLIKQIKARWARLQFDKRNRDKKQVNVMLTSDVITQLDELAAQHHLKRAQVIEILIKKESELGTLLHEARTAL